MNVVPAVAFMALLSYTVPIGVRPVHKNMKHLIMNISRRALFPALSLLAPSAAWAQGGGPLGIGVVQGYQAPARNLPLTILLLINYVLGIVGVIALAFLVYGGFLYITSRGDEGQVDTAKRVIFNAVIGIVVIGVAAALVNFVVGGLLQAG